MSRPLRIEFEGAWYHVMNRGAGRRPIFESDHDRQLFLKVVGEISETFKVQVHAYCLLDNQYHLLLCTPFGNLGRAMRHLGSVYTQRFNRRNELDGPLFRGRYKALLVDPDSTLAEVSRYIHRRPVDEGVASRLDRFRWSSYSAYIGRVKVPDWLHLRPTLDFFGKRDSQRRCRAFVAQGVDEETQIFYAKKRMPPVFGSDAFRDEIRKKVGTGLDDPEFSQRRLLANSPDIEAIVQQTAEVFGVEPETLYQERRGRGRGNTPRTVAMALCRTLGGYPLKEIAEEFGVGHYSSVSVAASRLKAHMVDDHKLTRQVEQLRKRLMKNP